MSIKYQTLKNALNQTNIIIDTIETHYNYPHINNTQLYFNNNTTITTTHKDGTKHTYTNIYKAKFDETQDENMEITLFPFDNTQPFIRIDGTDETITELKITKTLADNFNVDIKVKGGI